MFDLSVKAKQLDHGVHALEPGVSSRLTMVGQFLAKRNGNALDSRVGPTGRDVKDQESWAVQIKLAIGSLC